MEDKIFGVLLRLSIISTSLCYLIIALYYRMLDFTLFLTNVVSPFILLSVLVVSLRFSYEQSDDEVFNRWLFCCFIIYFLYCYALLVE